MKKVISASLLAAMLLNISACGTILYPERKGQKGGRLDPSVVILDGVGVLFFVIPGLIAYAVDFNNGTIYIPNSKSSSLDVNDMAAVNVDKDSLTKESAKEIVSAKTGKNFDLSKAEIYALDKNGGKVNVD